MDTVRLPLIKVGNSRGIRIPKAVIEQCGLGEDVHLEVKDQAIVLTPAKGIRSGWDEAFQKMAQTGEDKLLDENPVTDWEATEWEWK